jgi:hypothetical protein
MSVFAVGALRAATDPTTVEVGPGVSQKGAEAFMGLLFVLAAGVSILCLAAALIELVDSIRRKTQHLRSGIIPEKQRHRAYRFTAEQILASLTGEAPQTSISMSESMATEGSDVGPADARSRIFGSFTVPKARTEWRASWPSSSKIETEWELQTESEYDLRRVSYNKLEEYFRGMPFACLTRLANLTEPPIDSMREDLLVALMKASATLPADDRKRLLMKLLRCGVESAAREIRLIVIFIWYAVACALLLALCSSLVQVLYIPCILAPLICLLALLVVHGHYGDARKHAAVVKASLGKYFPHLTISFPTAISRVWLGRGWAGFGVSLVAAAISVKLSGVK